MNSSLFRADRHTVARALRPFLLLCTLALTACSGLAGEPRIVASLPPPTAAPTEIAAVPEVGYPLVPPDMQVGAALFAQYCTQCHGANGAGDGALVLSGQVGNPGNFTLPDAARPQRPVAWHSTITNGNLQALMPPWRNALTEEERWAVGYYTYTQHYDRATLEQGRDLYARYCAECHGETGRGDGPEASQSTRGEPVSSLTDLEAMSQLSDNVIYNFVTEGAGEAMPGFADDLSEAERWAVSQYTRTLMLANTEIIGQAKAAEQAEAAGTAEVDQTTGETGLIPTEVAQGATAVSPEATSEVPAQVTPQITPVMRGTVRGVVTNGTAGSSTPPDLTVELFVVTQELALIQQVETGVDAAGQYEMPDVARDPAAQYVARTVYRDRVYTSAITPGTAFTEDSLDLPITIYDLTDDPAVLTITGIATQVNTVEGSPGAEGNLEIVQVFNITNNSDRAFSTAQAADDGRPISLVFQLPPGAVVVGFGEQNRFLVAQDQFSFVDTLPVLPGEGHLVQVVYFIEYPGDAIIEQEIGYPLNGPVRLLVRPLNVRVQGDQFPSLGTEAVGQNEYASYGGDLSLEAGGVLRYQISGAGLSAASANNPAADAVTGNDLPLVLIGGIVLEVILVAALFLWYRRRRARYYARRAIGGTVTTASTASTPDPVEQMLIAEIAALDADHDAGRLDDAAYAAQRNALKARLADRLRRKSAE